MLIIGYEGRLSPLIHVSGLLFPIYNVDAYLKHKEGGAVGNRMTCSTERCQAVRQGRVHFERPRFMTSYCKSSTA